MSKRFLVPATVEQGSSVKLDRERSHYLVNVLRIRSKAEIDCFDGRGLIFTATVVDANSKAAELVINKVQPRAEPTRSHVHLCLAILKGQAMDRALQQATELGACEITPLITDRVNVRIDAKRRAQKLEHWTKILQNACEQCGQLYVPALNPQKDLTSLLQASEDTLIVLDETGEPFPKQMPVAPTTWLIGPEGGWSETEREQFAQASVTTYRLGELTLRAETVPAVALAMLTLARR